MINWEKELEKIFADPLLADIMAPRKRPTSSDRLIAGFQEISNFYETYGRLPEDNPGESSIYHKWVGLLKSGNKIERCRPFDELGILPQPNLKEEKTMSEYKRESTEEERLKAIFDDPLLSDVETDSDHGLFDIPEYMRQRFKAHKEADYIGRRVPCEDFDKYKTLFNEVHQGLKSGKYRLVKFSVKNLKIGSYFIEDGMVGFLAGFEDQGINMHGNRDGRTRVIYENGTESDIKYKTITKNLSVTGYSVVNCSDISDEELIRSFTTNDNDIESGTIYVLRSKSALTEIASIKDLYKIGFTVTSVESRIANAKKEPTYLYADVKIVATWKVYNVKSSTFEALIHKLFDSVKLQVTVDGHRPKEWFIVPFKVIEEAINAIIAGKPIEYNPQFQQIIYLS